MDYIVNRDISEYIIQFVSFRNLLGLIAVNSSLGQLVQATSFYAQWIALKNANFSYLKIISSKPIEHCFNRTGRVRVITDCALQWCYKEGYLTILQRLHWDNSNWCVPDCIFWALVGGQLAVLVWLKQMGIPPVYCSDTLDAVITNGHLAVLKWLHCYTTDFKLNRLNIQTAINFGHLSIVQWAQEEHMENDVVWDIDQTAANGHVELLNWLIKHSRIKYTKEAANGAAENGCLETLVWFNDHKLPFKYSADAVDHAAANNHVHIINWLHDHYPFKYTKKAIRYASEDGRLAVLDWFYKQGYNFGDVSRIVQTARDCKQMWVVQWYEKHHFIPDDVLV